MTTATLTHEAVQETMRDMSAEARRSPDRSASGPGGLVVKVFANHGARSNSPDRRCWYLGGAVIGHTRAYLHLKRLWEAAQ